MYHFVISIGRIALFCLLITTVAQLGTRISAEQRAGLDAEDGSDRATPLAVLLPAPTLRFPADTDSNSPAFWERLEDGLFGLNIINSMSYSNITQARRVGRWGTPQPVTFTNTINGGRWMEAVLQDEDGTLYGYYHNEPRSVCHGVVKTAPRIGAARSEDGGFTWEDLGIIIEAPPLSVQCDTPNAFFYGGVGDFSVVLNAAKSDAYFFFSAYSGSLSQQGVAVGRMLWQHRDEPRGNVAIWDGAVWRYPTSGRTSGQVLFSPAGAIYPATISWHDPSGAVDAFWGPSVHWNTFLEKYVMLLNRASNSQWAQEGIYIAFADDIADPASWTSPVKLLDGGLWYPQVIGLTRGSGTDKEAGRLSRLFMGGESSYFIRFQYPDAP